MTATDITDSISRAVSTDNIPRQNSIIAARGPQNRSFTKFSIQPVKNWCIWSGFLYRVKKPSAMHMGPTITVIVINISLAISSIFMERYVRSLNIVTINPERLYPETSPPVLLVMFSIRFLCNSRGTIAFDM